MHPLETISLSKRFGSVCAVDDVSFTVERGEVFGYLGPNGSGKTTTIRCALGLLRPSGGEVRLFGESVLPGRATQHHRIGYLPGDFRAWPGLRVSDCLALLGRLSGGDGVRVRREELAERLGLDLRRQIRDLSKGNRQKVGVVSAFQNDPDLLILDEPTTGLDPLVRQEVLALIREAARRGASVLLSSHDLAEVTAICERAAILREGRLARLGAIGEVVAAGERRLAIRFRAGSGVPPFPVGQFEGVRVVEQEGESLILAYRGGPDAILKWVARYAVEAIATPEPTLEEAFFEYYRAAGSDADGGDAP